MFNARKYMLCVFIIMRAHMTNVLRFITSICVVKVKQKANSLIIFRITLYTWAGCKLWCASQQKRSTGAYLNALWGDPFDFFFGGVEDFAKTLCLTLIFIKKNIYMFDLSPPKINVWLLTPPKKILTIITPTKNIKMSTFYHKIKEVCCLFPSHMPAS